MKTEYKIPFGKHKNKPLQKIPYRELKKYLDYLKHPWTRKKDAVKDAIFEIENYLRTIK